MKDEILSNGKYIAQIKKDGYYYSYEKHENNSYLFSKSVSKKTGLLSEKLSNVPHIGEILNKYIPVNTVLIGEICSRKGGSNEVTKIMGCLPVKAIMRQKKDPTSKLYFYVHDIAIYLGHGQLNINADCRLKTLELLKDRFEKEATEEEKMFIEFAETYTEDLGTILSDAFANEEEGIVLKKCDGKIIPNKRPAWVNIKFKKEIADIDVICLKFIPPKYNYEGSEIETWKYFNDEGNPITKAAFIGWIGSIEIGAYDQSGELISIGTVSSGLTEALLEEIKKDPNKFIGKPLVIGAMEPGAKEEGYSLRHPYINSKAGCCYGFRLDDQDITPKDCLLSKIFDN